MSDFLIIFILLMFGQWINLNQQYKFLLSNKKKEKEDSFIYFMANRLYPIISRSITMLGFAFIMTYQFTPELPTYHTYFIEKFKMLTFLYYLIGGFGFDLITHMIFDGGLKKIIALTSKIGTNKR